MLEIYVPRTESYREGSSYRPLSAEWMIRTSSREVRRLAFTPDEELQVDTRKVYETKNITSAAEREEIFGQARSIDAALRTTTVPVHVENIYKKGEFQGGYYYLPDWKVIAHETSIGGVLKDTRSMGKGTIIGGHVKLEGVTLGERCEIGKGAVVIDSQLGDDVVVRQRAIVRDAKIGSHTYIDRGVFQRNTDNGPFGEIGAGSIVSGVSMGSQVQLGKNTKIIGPDVEMHDSVRLGYNTRIGANTIIGEQTTMGHDCMVAGDAVIGAESQFGARVRVARGVFLVSPTIAKDFEFIGEGNSPVGGVLGNLFGRLESEE